MAFVASGVDVWRPATRPYGGCHRILSVGVHLLTKGGGRNLPTALKVLEPLMSTCFVIQPFDRGMFDKRYRDVYEPAIKAAGFEPYRVDHDHGVTVPIDSIEGGIRSAQICLAEITTDNPNVWYELGFAFAARRPVVMVCSEARAGAKFPFDIQHRSIVIYKTESPSDFQDLAKALTLKLKAVGERDEQLVQIAETELVTPVAGLSPPELTLLAIIASGIFSPDSSISLFSAKRDAEKGGMTGMGFNLAFRRLQGKGFILVTEEFDERDGEAYQALGLSNDAWNWIDTNDSKFNLHKPVSRDEDDIPF